MQNKQRAQQGKQLRNENFWPWTTLSQLLVGCAVLLAALCGFLAWSRKRPDKYKTIREKAGQLLRRLAHADWKVATVGLGLLLAAALGVSASVLGVSIPLNEPLLRLAAL